MFVVTVPVKVKCHFVLLLKPSRNCRYLGLGACKDNKLSRQCRGQDNYRTQTRDPMLSCTNAPYTEKNLGY